MRVDSLYLKMSSRASEASRGTYCPGRATGPSTSATGPSTSALRAFARDDARGGGLLLRQLLADDCVDRATFRTTLELSHHLAHDRPDIVGAAGNRGLHRGPDL